MKSDESLELEVGASLRASAAAPAPDDLVARIGRIPAAQAAAAGAGRRLPVFARAGMNLAAAAVVVIAVAALVVMRGGNLPPGGPPNASPSTPTPGASAPPSASSACGSAASPNPASPNATPEAAPGAPVVVTLGIYSGRPDPAWTLTVEQAAALGAALAALPDTTGTPPVGGLGYHGFAITGQDINAVAYLGMVAPPGDAPRPMKTDPGRSIERCLLQLSRSHVTPGEYAIAEAAIVGPPPAPGPGASASPGPSATPAAPTPFLGFSPVSVTFVAPDDGWVLGKGTCPGGPCAEIERTADGGRTWVAGAAPDAQIFPGPRQDAPGIGSLRFADARDGWAFGPDLWSTHDGGVTWARLAIPGLASGTFVAALETAGGTVHAVVLDGGDYRIASSPVGADDFRLSPVRVPVGAGPVPAVQLVLSGAAGWLVENDRTVVGGARLVDGSWSAWQPPCLDAVGPAYLAASGPTELVAACDVGLWSTPTGAHLYVSHDGGSTFLESPASVPVTMTSQLAAAAPSVIVVGGTDATGPVLAATFDGGQSWAVVARPGAVDLRDLGFTTPTQGVVIGAPGDGPATLLMTRDGGRTWSAVRTTPG